MQSLPSIACSEDEGYECSEDEGYECSEETRATNAVKPRGTNAVKPRGTNAVSTAQHGRIRLKTAEDVPSRAPAGRARSVGWETRGASSASRRGADGAVRLQHDGEGRA